jgi:hypothetical protein
VDNTNQRNNKHKTRVLKMNTYKLKNYFTARVIYLGNSLEEALEEAKKCYKNPDMKGTLTLSKDNILLYDIMRVNKYQDNIILM